MFPTRATRYSSSNLVDGAFPIEAPARRLAIANQLPVFSTGSLVKIAFATRLLRTVCESQDDAQSHFGVIVATALKDRLADIDAAGTYHDLVAGRARIVGASLILDLPDDFVLSLVASHPKNPVDLNGEIDWEKVSRVKVVRIGVPNV
jgi:hypothetical protein